MTYIDIQLLLKNIQLTLTLTLTLRTEPENFVDNAVCTLKVDKVVGHLKKGKTRRFAKTVFYFLRANKNNSYTAIVKGKPVKLGDGEGMPSALLQLLALALFSLQRGKKMFIEVLRQQLLCIE